ncbi:hypothetical protein YC2023_054914 [Brassica napus]
MSLLMLTNDSTEADCFSSGTVSSEVFRVSVALEESLSSLCSNEVPSLEIFGDGKGSVSPCSSLPECSSVAEPVTLSASSSSLLECSPVILFDVKV